MLSFLKALRSVRRELNIAVVGSLVLIGCIEFWWRHYPPPYGWQDSSRLADVISNLCLAYVASWIFFFVRDHWEKREDEAKRQLKIEEAYLGLFEAAINLFQSLPENESITWRFIETDDLASITQLDEKEQGDKVMLMYHASIRVEEAYLQHRHHYNVLKILAEHLPPGTFTKVEDVNQAFLDLFLGDVQRGHFRSESRIKRKGDFGWKLNTLHLELFHLKNRLKRNDISINHPALKELLQDGHSWITREDRGMPGPEMVNEAELQQQQ
ncbi:MAG: hypothetical protein KA175_03125 [Flavobacteriales bacterium]|nr:hypothetical protein [Flavobacteriales bacterium]